MTPRVAPMDCRNGGAPAAGESVLWSKMRLRRRHPQQPLTDDEHEYQRRAAATAAGSWVLDRGRGRRPCGQAHRQRHRLARAAIRSPSTAACQPAAPGTAIVPGTDTGGAGAGCRVLSFTDLARRGSRASVRAPGLGLRLRPGPAVGAATGRQASPDRRRQRLLGRRQQRHWEPFRPLDLMVLPAGAAARAAAPSCRLRGAIAHPPRGRTPVIKPRSERAGKKVLPSMM
jgi:hypothetical protein